MGSILFLLFLITQRLSEVWMASANTQALLAQGGREHGANHYPIMVALHSAWIGCMVISGFGVAINGWWLLIFIGLQIFRVWILSALGGRWTTRIIVIDQPLVNRGPFRYFRHPNYMLVIAEIFVAPMVLGLVWVAVVFSILNALMLMVRINTENKALAHLR